MQHRALDEEQVTRAPQQSRRKRVPQTVGGSVFDRTSVADFPVPLVGSGLDQSAYAIALRRAASLALA